MRVKTPLRKKREEARKLFLSGELSTNAEIAAVIKVKPHTVGQWRKEEDWDALAQKLNRKAAETLLTKLASDRVELNLRHYKLWDFTIAALMEKLKAAQNLSVDEIVRVAGVLDKAQKGQRLAKGLGVDGETEEKIRTKSEAQLRAIYDVVMESVLANVTDEQTRDRIRRDIDAALPSEDEEAEEDPDE